MIKTHGPSVGYECPGRRVIRNVLQDEEQVFVRHQGLPAAVQFADVVHDGSGAGLATPAESQQLGQGIPEPGPRGLVGRSSHPEAAVGKTSCDSMRCFDRHCRAAAADRSVDHHSRARRRGQQAGHEVDFPKADGPARVIAEAKLQRRPGPFGRRCCVSPGRAVKQPAVQLLHLGARLEPQFLDEIPAEFGIYAQRLPDAAGPAKAFILSSATRSRRGWSCPTSASRSIT